MGTDASSNAAYLLAFRHGLSLAESAEGNAELRSGDQRLALRSAAPGFLAAIRVLCSGGATLQELSDLVEEADGADAVAILLYYVERFERLGMLTYTLSWEGQRIATLIPSTPERRSQPSAPESGIRYELTRFSILRSEKEGFTLESPLGFGRILIHDGRVAALCHALSVPRTTDELAQIVPELPAPALSQALGLMLGIEALSPAKPGEMSSAESLAMWSAHDLWFHVRSRRGRHDAPYGATFPWRDAMNPWPAVKPRMEGPVIPLFRPELASLMENDEPFTHVLEARRSIRRYGTIPIRVEQLGELLYRAARIRTVIDQNERLTYPITNRPYPGAGACYPLELYLAVRTCVGLAPGLYHYHAQDHALTMLSPESREVAALIARSRLTMEVQDPPQVVVVITARVQRVMWKYESMAYAAILKDTGALYQNLYLVATAMHLAPCAIGGGDSELFAAAAGLDPFVEPSVGEFALGSHPDTTAEH